LEIRLLGGFDLLSDGKALPRIATRKARSLLAFLVVHADRAFSRDALAELLWSHLDRTRALNNLRLALWAIRRVVEPYLEVDADTVRFRAVNCSVDVAEFERLARRGLRAQGRERAEFLRQAVELYRGGLLPGFYDEWVLQYQERLEALYLEAIDALAEEEQPLLRSPPLRAQEEAGLKRELARAHYIRREPETALALARQALHLYREAHDLVGQAKTHLLLGVIYRFLGRTARARREHDEALRLARGIRDRHTEWQALNNLGWLLWNEGRSREALAPLEEAEALCRRLQERRGRAIVLHNRGIALLDLGQHEAAKERFREALVLVESLQDQELWVENLSYRALAHLGLGEREEALRCTRNVLELLEEGIGTGMVYKVDYNAWTVLKALGEEREADRQLQRAYEDVVGRLHRVQDPELREGALYGNRVFREVCEARCRPGV